MFSTESTEKKSFFFLSSYVSIRFNESVSSEVGFKNDFRLFYITESLDNYVTDNSRLITE